MDEPELWDALRAEGVNADDPEIRATVRSVLATIDAVEERSGGHAARRCMESVHAALTYVLRHPDTKDMSSFEQEFGEE